MVFENTLFCLIFFCTICVAVAWLFWCEDFDGIRSSWEYHSRCNERERLSGDEFYNRFYQDGGIRPELVISFRNFHARYWEEVPELLRPEDDLFLINSGADYADWVAKVGSQFGVEIRWESEQECDMADASFDSVLRYIHRLQEQKVDG